MTSTTALESSATIAGRAAAAIAAAETNAPTGNRREVEIYTDGVNLDDWRRKCGDDAARKVFIAALDEYEHLDALRLAARDIRIAEKSLAELKAAGISLAPEVESAGFFQVHDAAAQAIALGELERQNKVRLSAACAAEVRRITSKLVIELDTELKRVAEFDDALRAKWPTMATPQTRLRSCLGAAVMNLSKEMQKPFDVSFHWSPRLALGYYFQTPL